MGLYAFLTAVVALVAAFILGKKKGVDSTTTKISGEVTIQRDRAEKAEKEAELAKSVSETVVETAKAQRAIFDEISEAESILDEADKERDFNVAIGVARKLAQIAREKQEEIK